MKKNAIAFLSLTLLMEKINFLIPCALYAGVEREKIILVSLMLVSLPQKKCLNSFWGSLVWTRLNHAKKKDRFGLSEKTQL